MAKSYRAVYEQGQLCWLDNPPNVRKARVLVTILEADSRTETTRAEQIRQRLEQTRGAWGKATDPATLEAEINALRDEWQQPWDSENAADS